METRAAETVELQVAIVGPPNAGKSSLINEMANRQVSIVSSEPGTTRDYVRLRLDLGGATVDFLDTAGLETLEGESPRAIAQGFTRQKMDNADLVLFCLSVDDAESEEWPIDRNRATTWLVRTKCDLDAYGRHTRRLVQSFLYREIGLGLSCATNDRSQELCLCDFCSALALMHAER